MIRKLKVGVIGVGVMGREHARIYKELPEVELVGLYDLNKKSAFLESKRLKCKSFEHISDLFSEVQAVSICTPTSNHFEVVKKALENNLSILVEKPFTNLITEAQELIDLSISKKLTLTIGHIERFNPIIKALKGIIKGKQVISINITRVGPIPPRIKDVGIILDLGTHDIDLIRYLTGSEFDKIYCVSNKKTNGFDDAAVMCFKMANGTIASVETNWFTPYKVRKIEIALMDRLLVGDFMMQEIHEFSGYRVGGAFVTRNIPVKKVEPLKDELKSFIACAKTGKKPLVSGIDGRKAIEIALECTKISHSS